MRKILGLLALALVLVLAACSPSEETPSTVTDGIFEMEEGQELAASSYTRGRMGTYEVTIENLSEGQPFTPPVAATHPFYLRLFITGRPTTNGVKEIAENGNVMPLAEGLANSRLVTDSVVALPSEEGAPPPILPGAKRTFELEGGTRGDVISFVSMLICTNDGFTGRTVRLPRRVGQTVRSYAIGYDAGTEKNTEAFEDIVPPCSMITLGEDNGGTGESNPALAENSVTKRHRNIQGNADLQKGLHGWDEPVAKIYIKRIK